MFSSDITYSVMQERSRDRRAQAKAARDAREARRIRRFWTEQAQRVTSRPRRMRPATEGR